MATIDALNIEIGADVRDLTRGIGDAEDSLGGLEDAASDLDDAFDGLDDGFDGIKGATEDLEYHFDGIGESLSGLSGLFDDTADDLDDFTGAAESLAGDLDDLTGAAEDLTGDLDDLKGATEDLEYDFESVGETLTGLSGLFGDAADAAGESADQVDGLTGSFDGLGAAADSVSSSSGDTASGLGEVAASAADTEKSFWDLISETWQLDEVLSTVQSATDTASGSLKDFAQGQSENRVEASHLARQMGITTGEYREFATSLSNATFPLEDVHALVDEAILQGREGEEAIADFANTWDMLGDATGGSSVEMAKSSRALATLEDDGWEAADSMDAFGAIIDTMGRDQLPEFLEFVERSHEELGDLGLDTQGAAAAMIALHDETGLTGRQLRQRFRREVNDADGDLDTFLGSLGLTRDEFIEMQDDMDGAGQAVEDLAGDFEEARTPIDEFNAFLADAGFEAGEMADLAAALALPLMAIGPILRGLGTGFKLLRLAFIATPVGWLVAGLLAVGFGLKHLWEESETFRDIVTGAWEKLQEIGQRVFDQILMPLFEELKEWWAENGEEIKASVVEAWQAIEDGLRDLKDAVAPLLDELGDDFIEKTGAKLIEGFEAFTEWWDENGEDILERIVEFAEFIGERLTRMAEWWDEHGEDVVETVQNLWSAIWQWVQSGWLQIRGIFNIFMGLLTMDWERVWEGITQILQGAWDRINAVTLGKAQEMVDGVVGWVTDLYDSVTGTMADLRDAVIGAWDDLVGGVTDKAQDLYDNTVGKVQGLYDKLVGNSIFPDLSKDSVREMQGLASGVDSAMGDMSTQALRRAANMARVLVRDVAAMARALGQTITAMGRQVGTEFTAMTVALVRDTSTLARVLDRAFSTLGTRIVRHFADTVRGVDRAWSQLPGVAGRPVRFLISTVYSRGLRPMWNRVAQRVPGINAISAMGVPAGLARGGVLGGYQAGKRDDVMTPMRSGEGVLVPEVVRGLGPDFVHGLNHLGNTFGASRVRRLRDGLTESVGRSTNRMGMGEPPERGFAAGGIVGAVNRWMGRDWYDLEGRLEETTKPIFDRMNSTMRSQFGQGNDFPGIPTRATAAATGRIAAKFKAEDDAWAAMMSGGGMSIPQALQNATGRVRRTLMWSRQHNNKPYIWGGVGPRGFDCSGWTSAITNHLLGRSPYRRMHTTHSFYGRSAVQGFRRGASSPWSVGVQRGHMGGTLAGVNMEAAGGRARRTMVGGPARGTSSFPQRFGFTPLARGRALGGVIPAASYDSGGYLPPGLSLAHNGTGRPEPVGHDRDPVRVEFDFAGASEEALVKAIRRAVRVRGGDVQAALSGGRR